MPQGVQEFNINRSYLLRCIWMHKQQERYLNSSGNRFTINLIVATWSLYRCITSLVSSKDGLRTGLRQTKTH